MIRIEANGKVRFVRDIRVRLHGTDLVDGGHDDLFDLGYNIVDLAQPIVLEAFDPAADRLPDPEERWSDIIEPRVSVDPTSIYYDAAYAAQQRIKIDD